MLFISPSKNLPKKVSLPDFTLLFIPKTDVKIIFVHRFLKQRTSYMTTAATPSSAPWSPSLPRASTPSSKELPGINPIKHVEK